MLDVPVNNHVLQLVVNLTSRLEAELEVSEEESQVSEDETDVKVTGKAPDRKSPLLITLRMFL